MSDSSQKPLQSVEWFPTPHAKGQSGAGSALAKLAVGAAMGLVLLLRHHPTAAIVVWAIAGVVGVVSLASSAARAAIDRALAAFGRRVGTVIGAVLLTLVYVLVVTPTRFVRRVLGADDLHLRDSAREPGWPATTGSARRAGSGRCLRPRCVRRRATPCETP